MEPRKVRRMHLLAGLGLILSAFVPTGLIETPWPPYSLHPWAWMEPFVWPFLLMGLLLLGAAARESVRPKLPAAALVLGATSVVLFLATFIVGRRAVYDLWFPDQLGPPELLVFDLRVLAAHYAVMIALTSGGIALLARRWWQAHPASGQPPGPPPPSVPSASLPPVPSASASTPPVPSSLPSPSAPADQPTSTPGQARPPAAPSSSLPSWLYAPPPPPAETGATTPPPPATAPADR